MFQPLGELRPTGTLIIVLALLLVIAVLAIQYFARKATKSKRSATPAPEKRNPVSSLGHWPGFFKGSGTILITVAIAAMLLAGAAATFRPRDATATVHELTASAAEPKPQVVDVSGSSNVTILAIADQPVNSGAILLVSDGRKVTTDVRRLKVTSGKWVLWRGDPKTDQLQIVTGRPQDSAVTAATSVKIVVIAEVSLP